MPTPQVTADLNDLTKVYIYHITDVSNLASIISDGCIKSDALMAKQQASGQVTGIGYSHIKARRLTQTTVGCCSGRYVGEFVPFYFCPRSPMLFTVNKGNTGKPVGAQATIVHLVSTMDVAIKQGRDWAFSDVSAATGYPNFFNDPNQLDKLSWDAIRALDWAGQATKKQAEFLVADHFDWTGVIGVGCMTPSVKQQVDEIIQPFSHRPVVKTKPDWCYL